MRVVRVCKSRVELVRSFLRPPLQQEGGDIKAGRGAQGTKKVFFSFPWKSRKGKKRQERIDPVSHKMYQPRPRPPLRPCANGCGPVPSPRMVGFDSGTSGLGGGRFAMHKIRPGFPPPSSRRTRPLGIAGQDSIWAVGRVVIGHQQSSAADRLDRTAERGLP